MKFAIINDMHIGPKGSGFAKGVQRKLTEESERLVKRFVNDMNETEHPKFVICLGDLIEDINDREKDIESLKRLFTAWLETTTLER
jgi:metallophosphoesterase superfamily enzyme